jgi:hypothetical protein
MAKSGSKAEAKAAQPTENIFLDDILKAAEAGRFDEAPKNDTELDDLLKKQANIFLNDIGKKKPVFEDAEILPDVSQVQPPSTPSVSEPKNENLSAFSTLFEPPKKEKMKVPKWVWWVAGVVGVLIIIVVIYYFFFRKKNKAPIFATPIVETKAVNLAPIAPIAETVVPKIEVIPQAEIKVNVPESFDLGDYL